MSRKASAQGADQSSVQAILEQNVEAAVEPFNPAPSNQTALPEEDAASDIDSTCHTNLLDQANQLTAKAKVALIRRLITQLGTDHIQLILEFGLREVGERYSRGVASVSESHNTRLLLKKDYSYQDRGLSQPTQYYVYLRRRKPKLDRYIGALFYIPQGCTLSYFLDAQGRIIFNPPHNIFQLQDSTDSAVIQVVRLICLEPPPPDYTFTKQQNDTPEIHLHLEYLDLKTYQPLTKQSYLFPACMYEGGKLDRYRWQVSTVSLTPALPVASATLPASSAASVPAHHSPTSFPKPDLAAPLLDSELPALLDELDQVTLPSVDRETSFHHPETVAEKNPPQPVRRVLELPTIKSLTFSSNCNDSDTIVRRMRLWVAWSEKAMPQSKWDVTQNGAVYTLMNAHFKRRILTFDRDRASITLENSLPVLMKWFHDLGLAVSQAQQQSQYSAAQLKLAHSLFVDMSLPQNDPMVVLKKLFGLEFSKPVLNRD
ncbi:MAG: hypothetical protein HC866_26995 [Leptolyngbyaceae cyanobacterium RU_5_1]|nr:hypothetical protein [Leptolyngbyaceae cyanobacterium RU_5_1]